MELKLFRKYSFICCFVLSSITVLFGDDIIFDGTIAENIASYIGGTAGMMAISLIPYLFYKVTRPPEKIKNWVLFFTQNTIPILYIFFYLF